ncbi:MULTISPECIES: hypothetical protein [Mesoplasma]|uniref:Uncharacterized protein n=1 Tax=Mesoplasma florum TaxID=2151 RepID=A0A2R3P7L9_MESFO|nr:MULTISPECIES: hypothetical protein [Mesoplasma]AVN64482.1 hypothetical protein CG003_02295 [Mesoplasma florum]
MSAKKKKLPSGFSYSQFWITENLKFKLNFFLKSNYLKEEKDYYYIFKKEIYMDFILTFNCKPPKWLIHDEQELKLDEKSGKFCSWYKIFKEDYKIIVNEIESKFGVNNFVEIYQNKLKEMNIPNSLFDSNNNLKKYYLDISEWISWLSIFNYVSTELKIKKIKFSTKNYKIYKKDFKNFEKFSDYEFFEKIDTFSEIKIKNFLNNVKHLRDYFSHFWNFKFKEDDFIEYKTIKFYTKLNLLAILIEINDERDFYILHLVNFTDIINAVESKTNSIIN